MRTDKEYLELLLSPMRAVIDYCPRLGQMAKGGVSASEFQKIYSADPFYHWLGLDAPEIYTAHRVAGGLTSLYRQIGIGCERMVRAIIQDYLGLSTKDTQWSYIVTERDRTRTIELDARVETATIPNRENRERFRHWLSEAAKKLQVDSLPKGAVFEIRQGYKSKDSKRQNADIQSAARAYQSSYLPCMLVLSQQIDSDLERRYRNAGWLVLKGTTEGDTYRSSYAFMRDVVGYDLQGLFERNQQTLQEQVRRALILLMQVEEEPDGDTALPSR
jgi:hypothetical protein